MRAAGVADQAGAFTIGWCGPVCWTRHSDKSGKYRVMVADEPIEVRKFLDIAVSQVVHAVVDDFGDLVRVP